MDSSEKIDWQFKLKSTAEKLVYSSPFNRSLPSEKGNYYCRVGQRRCENIVSTAIIISKTVSIDHVLTNNDQNVFSIVCIAFRQVQAGCIYCMSSSKRQTFSRKLKIIRHILSKVFWKHLLTNYTKQLTSAYWITWTKRQYILNRKHLSPVSVWDLI